MRHKNIAGALALSAFALAAKSCQDAPSLTWSIAPELAAKVEAQLDEGPIGSRVIWKRNGLRLSLKENVSNLSNDLVMVSILTDSDFAAELSSDPRVLALLPSPDGTHVHAVVKASDPLILNALATAAHAANGHTCGNLERLSTRPWLTSDASQLGPIYAESVYLGAVADLIKHPQATRIASAITTLENLGTRYHDSPAGKQASATVLELFKEAAAGRAEFDISRRDHSATGQDSVVVRIPGTDKSVETVVLGAHLDSIAKDKSDAPGADDDASGIATLVEVLRAIATSGATFQRTIELHAYAAEEVGLVGSEDIAYAYRDEGRAIVAMMQFDMNAYSADGRETIYLVSNDTDPTLRRSVKDLLNTYLGGDFAEGSLAGGTSDHRSWTRAGFAAVFPFENPRQYNPTLHTADDTSANLNALGLSTRFARLGLAFLAHQAGLQAAAEAYQSARSAFKSATSRDLHLAIQTGEAAGKYTVAVATDPSVARVELCPIATAGAVACSGARTGTTVALTNATRRFHVSESSMALQAGNRFAVFGYDEQDRVVAQRTIRLDAKN